VSEHRTGRGIHRAMIGCILIFVLLILVSGFAQVNQPPRAAQATATAYAREHR
jgi:hypothetical protein